MGRMICVIISVLCLLILASFVILVTVAARVGMKVNANGPFLLTTGGGLLILMLCPGWILICCCTSRSARLVFVTYSSSFVNLEPCKVGTSSSRSAAHPEREDATDKLCSCLELTQMGREPVSVMRNEGNGQ